MKRLISLEEVAQAAVAVLVFAHLPLAWWWLLVLFLLPDVSMLGYLGGPRVGAVCYNLAHHKAVALGVGVAGWYAHSTPLLVAGTVLIFHSAFDRMLGYGLKYPSSFKDTHLGALAGDKLTTVSG